MAKLLVSMDDYKQYKNIKGDADDSTITALLPAISDYVKNYCARTFVDYVTTDKTQYSDGGVNCIFLDEFPIISITSVNESWDNQATQTLLVENQQDEDGYYVDYETGLIQTVQNGNFVPAFHSVEIIYKAGFTEIPQDLKLAIYHLIDYYRKEQFTMKKVQGVSTVERMDSDAIPGHIKRTLDSYRATSL